MKIKKTYMPYKVSLFVGLLSFNTLYSCVVTNGQLGIRNDLQIQALLEDLPSLHVSSLQKENLGAQLAEKMERYYGNSEVVYCNAKKRHLWAKICGTVITITGLCSVAGYYLYNSLYTMPFESNDLYSTETNATAVLGNTTAALVPVVEQELVRVASNTASTATNLAVLATTSLPTLGILRAMLKPNQSSGSDVLSQDVINAIQPNNFSLNEKYFPNQSSGSDVLSQDVINAMELNDFSLDELQYLLKEGGVSPNGRFPNGQTLLMRAVDLSLPEVVEFLLKEKADVHLKDHSGNTPMMYIHFTNPSGKKIADLLLQHGANPCEKNNKGHSVIWRINSESSTPGLSEALKKCNTSFPSVRSS